MLSSLGYAALTVLGAWALVYAALGWLLRVPAPLAHRVTVTTPDGYTLPLFHHAAQGECLGSVLCLHGLGATHLNLQFPGPSNLAAHLAQAGFDVWVTGLRGDAGSPVPAAPGYGYSFDAYVRWDLPSVMEHVQAHNGGQRVHLVGHSMGGLLAYAYAAVHGDQALASIVAVGAPVGFQERTAVVDHNTWMPKLLALTPWWPLRWVGRVAVPFLGLLTQHAHIQRQMNAANVDLEHIRKAMWHTLSNAPRGVVLQFVRWVTQDEFCSQDGTVDYRAGLARLTVPLMAVAGTQDRLARVTNAQRALDLAASSSKEWLVLGKEYGCHEDYGHIDLIFGKRASQDVFSPVTTFLVRQAARASSQANA